MTIPNILSIFRLLLVPVFVVIYFSDIEYATIWAVGVYALASFTDMLDGLIARRYNMVSKLGRFLDPLGDKFMTLGALLCITIDGIIPVWAVVIFFIKELLMLTGGLILYLRKIHDFPPSNIFGKCSTVVFVLVCLSLMLFRDIPHTVATVMISVAIALMLVAFVTYVRTFFIIIRSQPKGNISKE